MPSAVRRGRPALWCLAVLLAAAVGRAQDPPKPPALPPNWSQMSPEEQAKWREEMKRRMAGRQDPPAGQSPEDRAKAMRDEKARTREEMEKALKIEAPADRDAVKATYVVGGETKEIKAGEFYDAYLRLSKFEERPGVPVTEDKVFEHLLTLAEARALGFDCTVEEFVAGDPLEKNATLKAETKKLWERQGITEELYRAYEIERRIAQKARDFHLNTARVSSQSVFDAYKGDRFTYRVQYVAFGASEIAEEMQKTPPAEADLLRFWNDDKGVQNQFRTPTTVDAEFVFFDQSSGGDGSADPASAASAVSYEEALSYYRRNKERLDELLTSEQRAKVQPTGKVDPSEIASPFDFLRPQIEKEIRASGRVRVAFNEAKSAPGGDLKALAEKYKLGYASFSKAERQAFVADPRFGLQIFGSLFNAEAGKLSGDLTTERQTQFFWRLNGKAASALPDFSTVKDRLGKAYYETAANGRAADAAKAARAELDAAVDAELKNEIDQRNTAADQNADREIKARNVSDQKQIDEIKARHRQIAQQQLTPVRNIAAGRVFDKIAQSKGWKVEDTGDFELQPARFGQAAPAEQPLAEARLAVVKSQQTLRSMPIGSVSQVVSDGGTKSHYLMKLAERKEPDFSKISESDYLRLRGQAERTVGQQAMSRNMYHELSRRMNLQTR